MYGVKADDTHTSLFLQVLQLTLPVAAHATVNLPQRREDGCNEKHVLQGNNTFTRKIRQFTVSLNVSASLVPSAAVML